MILFLDTTDLEKIYFALIGDKVIEYTAKVEYRESHKTLGHLEKFLKKNNLALHKSKNRGEKIGIKKIITCSGPGSFTGIRIGITIAQALGFALNIPAVAIKKANIPENLKNLIDLRSGKMLFVDYGSIPGMQ